MKTLSSDSRRQNPTPNPFLRAWAWKREHRPDRDRHDRPYNHKLKVRGVVHELVIYQSPFKTAGFASTGFRPYGYSFCSPPPFYILLAHHAYHANLQRVVFSLMEHIEGFLFYCCAVWDSAIVLSKYLERWPCRVEGKHCIELGAGCGLPGIAAAYLGASSVLLTDLPENLDLLRQNVAVNEVQKIVSVSPLVWGSRCDLLACSFSLVIATDVMYHVEAVDALLSTFKIISGAETKILLAYGRNRQAEHAFLEKACIHFSTRRVSEEELDEVYQCVDVDVLELMLKT